MSKPPVQPGLLFVTAGNGAVFVFSHGLTLGRPRILISIYQGPGQNGQLLDLTL